VTIVFRQGENPFSSYTGIQDTYIGNAAPGDATTVFGGSDLIALRADNLRRGLVQIDVSLIPLTATVLMANLSLYVDSQTSLPLTVTVHNVLRPWAESDATWLQAANGSPWAAPGASATSDTNAQPAAIQTLQTTTWYDFDLRSLVAAWVANPVSNRGVLLAGPGSGSGQYFLRSSDYADLQFRPKLVVTYIP
jgi:hypothetical protein